ncbi:MAG: hypothetical protein KDD06_05260 [Phaeodactylibacter sp.]|nr:hypothetical protein [Phaeodactylibacter sp.]MCB9286411.1 hypothetical protein [Lewinellaceae bacterium]
MFYTPEEIKGYEEELGLLIRKLHFFKEERNKAVDAGAKFSQDEEIARLEKQIRDLKLILASANNIHSADKDSLLMDAARGLNIDEEEEFGLLHLVNVDRKEMRGKFWDAFDENEEKKQEFQYYFISACPSQMPPSFAERMVYELLLEELDGDSDSLHIVTYEDTGRLRIQDLPVGRNARKCRQRFKEYVQERFRFADTQSFDTFIETGVPKLPYDYVAVAFELHERHWEDFLPEYLQWMIDTFRCPHQDVPVFLFFFVIYIEKQHLGHLSPAQQAIVDALKSLAQRNETTLLTPLLPVEEGDLRAWLMDLGERNPNKVQQVMDVFLSGLREADRRLYEEKKLLNMKDIEELQAIVYRVANE